MSNYYEQQRQGVPVAEKPPVAPPPNTAGQTSAGPQSGQGGGYTVSPPPLPGGQGQPAPGPTPNTGAPGGPAYNTPGGSLGHQIGESVRTIVNDSLKTVGQVMEEVSRDLKSEMNPGSKGSRQPAKPPVQQGGHQYGYVGPGNSRNTPKPAPKQTPPWYGKPVAPNQKPTNYAGVGQIVAGGVGLGFFGFMGLALVLEGFLLSLALTAPLVAISGVLLGFGIQKHDYTKRLLAYQSHLMRKNVMTFPELAKATGFEETQVRKDFRKGLRKGTLKYVFLDRQGDTVMLGENTYNLYLQSEELREQKAREEAERKQLMDENPELAQLEIFRTEGAAMLEKIREANEAIPGEEISNKLDTLEETCAKIFSYVESRPKKLPDTRKFMNYYLPTTLKLVDKYREYEEMEAQTPSIIKARVEIEHSLDTINVAFHNLLDELYKDDTLDVSTDIEVLHTMLAQEGLTGKKFKIDVDREDLKL